MPEKRRRSSPSGRHVALRLLGVVLAVAALLRWVRDVAVDGWEPVGAARAPAEVLGFGAVALLGVVLERRAARSVRRA